MVESSLLSKDEPLTPNIDKVMGVSKFTRRAQNTTSAKIGLLDLGFYFFLGPGESKSVQTFFSEVQKRPRWGKRAGTNRFTTA